MALVATWSRGGGGVCGGHVLHDILNKATKMLAAEAEIL